MRPRGCTEFAVLNRVADVIWSLITWGLLLALLSAAIIGFYLYNRVDEEIRNHVETLLAQQYPQLEISVRSAKLLELEGFEIRGISLATTRQMVMSARSQSPMKCSFAAIRSWTRC